MAIGETAKLVSSLELNTQKFDQGIGKATKGLGQLQTRTIAAGTAIGVGLERIAEKGLSALGNAIGDGIKGAQELERAQAQTGAVIASTGGKAGVSAAQVRGYAEALEDVTTADDKAIQQGENLLLTFTNIGAKTFPQATEAMVNMAIAMNKGDAATADFDGTAIQLGKALNDPIKGITALSKVGVSFSDAQKKAIKQAVKAGDTYKAQQIILRELGVEFGKAGKAAGQGFTADINRANDAIGDAEISIAQGLIPAVGEVARELSATLKDPQVTKGLQDLGKGIGGAIKAAVAFAKTVPWGTIASSLQAAAGFAKDLLNAFLGLPTWVQTAVVTGWGLNKLTGGLITDLASGLIKGVLGMTAGVVNINAGVVNGGGGLPTGALETAAGGAALGVGAGLLTVALATASIAALGILITNAIDPQHIGATTGKAATATARGIPDWNNKALQTLHAIEGHTDDTAAQMEKLRGLIAQPPKTLEQATAILAAGAQRDKETSDAIATIVNQQATSNDIETLRGNIAQGLQSVDTTTMLGAHQTSTASTQAGFGVARQTFASGVGIENAIRSIDVRPVINVEISATNVTRVNVEADRGGSRSGSRDGEGGGGPGQG